jgi:hypothetical protein
MPQYWQKHIGEIEKKSLLLSESSEYERLVRN